MHKQMIGSCKLATLMLIGVLLSGCPMNDKDKKQEETLNNFQTMLRFSEYHGLMNFIDPEYLRENPITSLEMNRLRQYQVSSYDI
ncbi:MAG: hypothetical protein PF630_09060, partial [Gammaproteobacteria bacterium]|nr:hypothetical protein [Gammaproteobacteria bacterium]